MVFFFLKQKTAYEVRISDCSSDVCSSDLRPCTSPCATQDRPACAGRSLLEQAYRGQRLRAPEPCRRVRPAHPPPVRNCASSTRAVIRSGPPRTTAFELGAASPPRTHAHLLRRATVAGCRPAHSGPGMRLHPPHPARTRLLAPPVPTHGPPRRHLRTTHPPTP